MVGNDAEAPQPLSEAAEAEGVRAVGCGVAAARDDHFGSMHSVSAEGNIILFTHTSFPCVLVQKHMTLLNDYRLQFHVVQTDTCTDVRYHASVRTMGAVIYIGYPSCYCSCSRLISQGLGSEIELLGRNTPCFLTQDWISSHSCCRCSQRSCARLSIGERAMQSVIFCSPTFRFTA